MDFYSFYTGQEFEAYKYLGTHQESSGWVFRTFAPQASGTDLLIHGKEIPMERIYDGNFFEATVPDAAEGDVYEYRIYDKGKRAVCHMDPYGYGVELRPDHKSVVRNLLHHEFRDKKWMKSRSNMLDKPLNIYEIHAGSWKKPGEKPDDWYSYTELVNLLIP